MQRYRFNFMNHFIPLQMVLFLLILVVLLIYWLEFTKTAIVIFGLLFLVNFLPAVYLHLVYWYKNKGEQFEVTESELIRYTNCKAEVFKADNIESCTLYKSASADRGGFPITPMEQYFYARLLFRTGEELIMTCLLTHKLDQVLAQLKDVPTVRKKRAFNPLWWK